VDPITLILILLAVAAVIGFLMGKVSLNGAIIAVLVVIVVIVLLRYVR
jgi:uncharacterized membrane protein YccC